MRVFSEKLEGGCTVSFPKPLSLLPKSVIFPTLFMTKINKLMSVFFVSVLLLMIDCIISLSKWPWNHEPQASGSAANFDNNMTKFIFNKRTDA